MNYDKKTIPQLIKIATKHFNLFIRNRDADKGCVSCGGKVEQAGHFYNSKNYSLLRFSELNVHGQCIYCNMHLSGNLIHYRRNITSRITEEDLKELDLKADNRAGFKWLRHELIETIEKYKQLNKL